MRKPSAVDSLSTKGLLKALRRLQPNQSPRARRNARASALARLKGLREFIDETFPLLDQKRGPERDSCAMAHSSGLAVQLAVAAGYHPRKAPVRSDGQAQRYVARWCVDLSKLVKSSIERGFLTAPKLREARANLTARAALFSSVRLLSEGKADG